MPELEEARAALSRMQQYKSACEDLRNAGPDFKVVATSLLSTFRDDRLFLAAIGHYCASGTFHLDASSRQKCTERRKLTEPQLEFLRQLSAVKTDTPARLIRLECVDFQGSLNIMNMESGGLVLKNVSAGRIFVALSKLHGGIRLENVKVENGLAIYAVSVDAPIEIFETEIGNNATWRLALAVADSAVRSVSLGRKTKVGGKLDFSGSRIANRLTLNDVEVTGDVVLNYVHVDRIQISKGTFGQAVSAEHAHVEKQFSIDGNTRVVGNFLAEHLHAGDMRVEGSKFGRSITLSRAKIASVRFTQATTIDSNCSQCNLNLWDANVLHMKYMRGEGINIFAGNARFHTFMANGGTIPKFDCSDCLVEQYMLIASKMAGRTSLAGAEIKGTLTFNEGNRRACWTAAATLDLSEVRADVIAANAADLLQLSQTAPADRDCTDASEPPAVSTTPVPTRLSGARYRAITPARFDAPHVDPPKYKATPLIGLPAEGLVRLIKSGRREGSGDGYDPQPYEELAEALTRAGESQKARELRIAKIDDRLATTDVGFVQRAFYWSYRAISRYGFENERAALIFLAMLAMGMAIHLYGRREVLLKLASRKASGSLWGLLVYSFWFSLDRAIPPLHLDPHMHEVRGQFWLVQHYFYFHRVCGTYLISVFAAGAAGFGH